MKQNIKIPTNLDFSDLGLWSENGKTKFNWSAIKELAEANNIEMSVFDNPDNVAELINVWYAYHRANGGAKDIVAERMLKAVATTYDKPLVVTNDLLLEPPTPEQILTLRTRLQLSQDECAKLCGISGRALWQKYEKGTYSPSAQTWTLFCLATGQHPRYDVNNVH